MSAFIERRVQDLAKLENLAKTSNGKIEIVSRRGNPISDIQIKLRYVTVPSDAYPRVVQMETDVLVQLSGRYPFQEPTALIGTPIFHPNVYPSGKICFGTKWLPTEGLDLLVKRIVRIITFDQTILNERSPANSRALTWYQSAVKRYPNSFPTDSVVFTESKHVSRISWKDVHH